MRYGTEEVTEVKDGIAWALAVCAIVVGLAMGLSSCDDGPFVRPEIVQE